MKFRNPSEFKQWPSKAVTLLGMSGVGKTTLANKIPKDTWFHYSADYRIGTHYLSEPILDNIKRYAMKDAFLAELLRSDSIYICSNITVNNLAPISSFLGKIGDPARGGLSLGEFKRRQRLHREAEIGAMKDVADFIEKARDIYGYRHFINDAGGSVCELDDAESLRVLDDHTVILYIKTNREFEEVLIQRAATNPKPLYYQEAFLDRNLEVYLREQNLSAISAIDPDHFVRWIFPKLIAHRLPRYQAMAELHGYTVDYRDIEAVRDDRDFIELICAAIGKQDDGVSI